MDKSQARELDKAIDNLIIASRRFEYWKDRGTHGDGKLDEMKANLKDARKALKATIRTLS